MAILEINKICVFGLHTDRKAILETLHKKEVVEVCTPSTEDIKFQETAKVIAQCDKHMLSAETALAILDEHTPEKSGFLAGRLVLPMQKYHIKPDDHDTALESISHIIDLSDKVRGCAEHIRQITTEQTALTPFLALDVPLDLRETTNTSIKVGALDELWQIEEIQSELVKHELTALHFEIINASKERTYIWLVFLKTQSQKTNEFLQKIGFSESTLGTSRLTSIQKHKELENEKTALAEEIQKCIIEIKECGQHRRSIELFYDHLSLRKDKYRALSNVGMTEHVFLLEGYVPQKYGADIKQLLENKYASYVELTKPTTDDAPVIFQNNAVVSPVETISETYGMPSSSDIDPNPIMAFFYYLFFGMMLSDAGYGLLIALVCGYLGFSQRLERPKRRTYRMFFFCGLSTMFWGLMYGGFFGNIIYTISTTFFGKEITLAPIWLDPISQAMSLLIFSVSLGMIQILIGLGIKFYTQCRQKEVWGAIFDTGFWMLVLIGLCTFAAGTGLHASTLATIGTVVALSGAVGIVLTSGRKNKRIIGKALGGVVSLYNIMGYVSDALSYCRLMALGLATGAIANVVNLLGSMFGSSIMGTVLFIVVFIFGHSLNFAMNMLGAYVHTNRLQYVEFFSKFYEGSGRSFAPFRMHTKYCLFSET